jgi:hypothetical protein
LEKQCNSFFAGYEMHNFEMFAQGLCVTYRHFINVYSFIMQY